jgi:DNA-binding transcriptional LysR family regulator
MGRNGVLFSEMATIDLSDLAVFVAVADAASFSGAAARLGLPTSSVSRAIHRLEEALGARALHRTTRRVALSAAGKALYDKVWTHVAQLRHAVGELPELEAEPSGRVRVTAVADMSELLAEVVSRFVARYPAAQIELRLTNDHVDLVAEGIDLALKFVKQRLKDSSLNARKLRPNYVQLFASPSYLARRGAPRTPADLAGHEWVVHKRLTELKLEGGGRSTVIQTRGRVVCADFSFMRTALINGCGVGILRTFQVEPDVSMGKLVRVLPRWHCRTSELWAVWPGSRHLPRTVSAFLDLVVESLEAQSFSPVRG